MTKNGDENRERRRRQAEMTLDFWDGGPRHAAAMSLELAMYDEYRRGLWHGKVQGFLAAALPAVAAAVAAWVVTR
jgi:hypothetical protein